MKKKISEVAFLLPGINQSRIDKYDIDEPVEFYDQKIFEEDFSKIYEHSIDGNKSKVSKGVFLNEGDIVISNTVQLATIVGNSKIKRIPTINFTKVDLNNEIDKLYFVYLYNMNRKIQQQKLISTQTMGLVQRITLKSMEEIELPILPMKQQIKIGESYLEHIKLKSKLDRYGELIEMMTYFVLENNMEE